MENIVVEHSSFRVNSVTNWLITASIVFLAVFGVILSLICIYALPDGSVQPKLGSIFFLSSAVVIVFLLSFIWKKERILKNKIAENAINRELMTASIHEALSDKILKWVVSIYSLFFVFQSAAITLICIYSLPDKTVQPATGFIYFLGGAFVAGCFVYAVWKRR